MNEKERQALIRELYLGLLNRDPDSAGLASWSKQLEKRSLSDVIVAIVNSPEFRKRYLFNQVKSGGRAAAAYIANRMTHFQIGGVLHPPRLKMVQKVVPAGKKVLDLGGASARPEGALLEMGYPHAKDLTIVDLPLDIRFKPGVDITSEFEHNGTRVRYAYHSMANLSYYEDDSFDLVWSGQTYEHIDEEEGKALFPQIARVLRPGGIFAMDTPNRSLTRILVGDDEWIHAEHKIEYQYEDFVSRFDGYGLELIDRRGILNMPETLRLGHAVLSEISNNNLNFTPETSYCFYLAYRKPL